MLTDIGENKKQFRLENVFRSDLFRHLCLMLSKAPELEKAIRHKLITVFAVVDANRVNGELRWRLRRRKKPDARTALHEALDSGMLVLVAPTQLRVEIEDDLAEIAGECGATPEQALDEWNKFAAKLLFYRPISQPPEGPSIDPDDLPYKFVSKELGLPVYTTDQHLMRMGAPVMWACVELDSAFRTHARSGSITVGCTLGSAMSVTVGVKAIESAVKLIGSAYSGFSRLPTWLQLAIAAAVSALILHPKSRAKALEGWKRLSHTLENVKEPLLDLLLMVAEELMEAAEKAADTREAILAAMPAQPSRISALVRARRICLLAKIPLRTCEISRKMRGEGHVSRSKDFDGYLRRKLRASGQFIEMESDRWQLRPSSVECG